MIRNKFKKKKDKNIGHWIFNIVELDNHNNYIHDTLINFYVPQLNLLDNLVDNIVFFSMCVPSSR